MAPLLLSRRFLPNAIAEQGGFEHVFPEEGATRYERLGEMRVLPPGLPEKDV